MSENGTHTPGPWKAEPWEFGEDMADLIFSDGTSLGVINGYDIYGLRIADAHLIAAAPDLYAALEELLYSKHSSCDCGVDHKTFAKAEAAIAKAEGR